MSAKSIFNLGRAVIVTIAAAAPLASAHAAQDCRGDPFYSAHQYSGETASYNCTPLSSDERQAAMKQRGAEGPIKSVKTEREHAQNCQGDPFYSVHQYSGETASYNCTSLAPSEGVIIKE